MGCGAGKLNETQSVIIREPNTNGSSTAKPRGEDPASHVDNGHLLQVDQAQENLSGISTVTDTASLNIDTAVAQTKDSCELFKDKLHDGCNNLNEENSKLPAAGDPNRAGIHRVKISMQSIVIPDQPTLASHQHSRNNSACYNTTDGCGEPLTGDICCGEQLDDNLVTASDPSVHKVRITSKVFEMPSNDGVNSPEELIDAHATISENNYGDVGDPSVTTIYRLYLQEPMETTCGHSETESNQPSLGTVQVSSPVEKVVESESSESVLTCENLHVERGEINISTQSVTSLTIMKMSRSDDSIDNDENVKSNDGQLCKESHAGTKNDGVNSNVNNANMDDSVAMQESAQVKFNAAMRAVCQLVQEDSVLERVSHLVHSMRLSRTLPPSVALKPVLGKLDNLTDLDLAECKMGPQAFRVVVLSLANNTQILKLNLAGNSTDVDCAACLGKMLSTNCTLEYLDVSDNYLGKDYFSRSVGQALATNISLKTLKFNSCGGTDLTAFLRHVHDNQTLRHLDMSNNSLTSEVVGQELSSYIRAPLCSISCLELKNCSLCEDAFDLLIDAVSSNNTLVALNVSGNKVHSFTAFLRFLVVCADKPSLDQLICDNMKVTQPGEVDVSCLPSCTSPSNLRSLSVANNGLQNNIVTAFAQCVAGMLTLLTDVNLESNPLLTSQAWDALFDATGDRSTGFSNVERLSLSSNDASCVADQLRTGRWPKLHLLNLRKVKMSTDSLPELSAYISGQKPCLSTLVLDGLKLSGTQALGKLFGSSCTLDSLSLSGCSLADNDLTELTRALSEGLRAHTLKLSGNRLTDAGLVELSNALLKGGAHPLERLDLSNNRIGCDGAKAISQVFHTDKCTSSIGTLLLPYNCIGKEGLIALVGCLGRPPLKKLGLNNQDAQLDEEDMNEVFVKLAKTLGFDSTVVDEVSQLEDNMLQRGDDHYPVPLPLLPDGLLVNLSGLGGVPGPLGSRLDSAALITDFSLERKPWLSLSEALQLGAHLRRNVNEACRLTSAEWNEIISEKDAPSWLKLDTARQKAIYMTGLPSSVSINKLEGLLEMDVDCNVEEVCLMKDIITKQNNGIAWVLMSDEDSCQRAVDFYKSGQAKLFGSCFTISKLSVTIDDEINPDTDARVKRDMEVRLRQRKQEQEAHGALILESAAASKARHEYRLLHPAYADGRIW